MKKITAILLLICLSFCFCVNSVAASDITRIEANENSKSATKPSGYNTCVGGDTVTFSGSQKVFTANLTQSGTICLECGVSDPGNLNSFWNVYIKKTGTSTYQYVALVDGTMTSDYEIFTFASAGSYTIKVVNVSGASNANNKAATMIFWKK